MTTDKNNAAPDPQPAELADASVIEHVAQQWDGCKYEAPGETLDIGDEIRRAGKRLSVELAEQQGEGSLNTSEGGRRYVADFFARELRRHDFTRYITTTLAADFACALAQHLAATGKQPVGEVQGDALQLANEWRHVFDGDGHDMAGANKNTLRRFIQAIDALAARQPGAQEPVGQVRTRVDGGFVAELCPGVADRVSNMAPLYVAPPAQGIDLGQLERIRNELHAMSGQVPDEWIDPIVELQQDVQKLIDGQRDAAPGVSRG